MIAALLLAAASPTFPLIYAATLDRVVDGDTVVVRVDAWAGTPFETQALRIYGIDTPEERKPPAKCKAEVRLGLAARAYGRTLANPGDRVEFTFHGLDKYGGRIDAALRLPNGRDWAGLMLGAGHARPYDGGTKATWCPRRVRALANHPAVR